MKKFIGGVIPFIVIHLFCCGSLLFFLVGSGYLLRLYNESQNKLFLIPSLMFLFLTWKLLRKKDPNCEHSHNPGEIVWRIFLYLLFYLIVSYIFIVYLFIPWWIPGYEGGPLLL